MRLRLRPLPGLLALLVAGVAHATGEDPAKPVRPPVQDPPSAIVVAPERQALPGDASESVAPPSDLAAAGGNREQEARDATAVADAPPPVPVVPTALAQPARRGDDVFARIRRGLGSNVCAAGSSSERWRRRYTSNPAAFADRLERILPLLDFVSVEVERVKLPSEMAFIPLVESWYKPDAMGTGGPAGMWQMIGSTARNHGIHIQPGYDGRLSPVESTRAALSYLKVLHDMFGGWEATVMAYNAGEGRMLQAFKRARSRDTSGDRRRPHGLSNITYDYVAKLQALSCLVAQPERNGLRLPGASRFVPLGPVLIGPGVASLEQFANMHGRKPADLRRLNPGYREGRVVAGVPRLVLMPLAARPDEPVVALADGVPAALPTTNPSGLSADSIALAVSQASAVGTAPIDARADATVGEAVVGDAEVAAIAPAAAMLEVADVAPPQLQTHQVVAGESLWTIARMHKRSIEQLRQLNRLGRRAVVRPGQTLDLGP